jgi:hypothetical protein
MPVSEDFGFCPSACVCVCTYITCLCPCVCIHMETRHQCSKSLLHFFPTDFWGHGLSLGFGTQVIHLQRPSYHGIHCTRDAGMLCHTWFLFDARDLNTGPQSYSGSTLLINSTPYLLYFVFGLSTILKVSTKGPCRLCIL